jgi:antitoxin (DNA-binding transcriptional repressor) of toxin-antitoxin stability system
LRRKKRTSRRSGFVERAEQGEENDITRRGTPVTLIVIERLRKRGKLSRGVSMDELLEEGRIDQPR